MGALTAIPDDQRRQGQQPEEYFLKFPSAVHLCYGRIGFGKSSLVNETYPRDVGPGR